MLYQCWFFVLPLMVILMLGLLFLCLSQTGAKIWSIAIIYRTQVSSLFFTMRIGSLFSEQFTAFWIARLHIWSKKSSSSMTSLHTVSKHFIIIDKYCNMWNQIVLRNSYQFFCWAEGECDSGLILVILSLVKNGNIKGSWWYLCFCDFLRKAC